MEKRILIPQERLAVIIGSRGIIRKRIEKLTSTKLIITDDVEISGEPLDVLTAGNIVTAIARGFSPEHAFELAEEDVTMSIIDLPHDDRSLRRIRSRLIGTRGKTRRNIEEYTKTHISIYGKTVAVIGLYERVDDACEALEKLIKGHTHKTVYKFLEEKNVKRRTESEII